MAMPTAKYQTARMQRGTSMPKYPELKPWELEPQFSEHMLALTVEKLHSKGDIAAQLAWRDRQIAEQNIEITELRRDLKLSLAGVLPDE